jgi:hypothetical protein
VFRFIQKLHIVAGLIAIILILFLTVTGLLINHREGLDLHESYTENPFVIWLYGFDGEGEGEEDFIEEPPTWERVLTAFHAGNFFGRSGILFLDIAGVFLIFLTVTGAYLWVKRLILLKTDKEVMEEEALIEKTEKLLKVRNSARGFLQRAGKLHNISEHVLEHIKASPEGPVARDIEEIEGHLVELDSRMHALIERIENLEKDVTSG